MMNCSISMDMADTLASCDFESKSEYVVSASNDHMMMTMRRMKCAGEWHTSFEAEYFDKWGRKPIMYIPEVVSTDIHGGIFYVYGSALSFNAQFFIEDGE